MAQSAHVSPLIFHSAILLAAGALTPTSTYAADPASLQTSLPAPAPRFSIELHGGHLSGTAYEYVYNIPGDGSKVSQLNWQIDNAAVLAGRVAFTPHDGLSVRLGGWAVVSSDTVMDDFDWLRGYEGFDTWSHWSHSDDTRLPKAFQLDVSGALRVYATGPFTFSGLLGYRFTTFKMNSYGGQYIYSDSNGFRNVTGDFPADKLSIAYQQWWHTPYLGIAAAYANGPWAVTGELIASPFVVASDKDHHNLRNIVFTERFAPSWMIGVTLGAEYALTNSVSVTAKADYETHFNAYGGSTLYDGDTNAIARYRKPAAGGGLDTLMLTLGLKVTL